jgi:hypothetical protein
LECHFILDVPKSRDVMATARLLAAQECDCLNDNNELDEQG